MSTATESFNNILRELYPDLLLQAALETRNSFIEQYTNAFVDAAVYGTGFMKIESEFDINTLFYPGVVNGS